MFSGIWQSLLSFGTKIIFNIGLTPIINTSTQERAPACLSPDGKTMTFRDESCITEENLQEELIHRYQKYYYGSSFVSTIRNYEFEAKVIQDVLSIMYGGAIRGTYYFNSMTDQERYIAMITHSDGGSISISEFNSLCNVWYYPYAGANNTCSFSFSPEVFAGILSGNFIHGSISY